MDISFYDKPVNVIKIDNLFDKDTHDGIFHEAIANESFFQDATIGSGLNKDIRSNTVAYYDDLYQGKREHSQLLNSIDRLFNDNMIRELLESSPEPFPNFDITNSHETQVSRYGDNNQKYDWHIDRMGGRGRLITFVYYFGNKKYTGGKIRFTNSPMTRNDKNESVLLMDNPEILEFDPKPNTGFFFSSTTPHNVTTTSSPVKFSDGRFSVNCWIGIK